MFFVKLVHMGQIMELHSQHYKDDFDMDKELIPKLDLSGEPEDRRLLWMSRPCGTYTLREWEVYLESSHANNVWKFYHEQTKDPVLAYALSIKDVQDGASITLPYQDRRQLMNELMPVHGSPKSMTDLPKDERELAVILKRERLKRSCHATNGNIKEYIDGLKKNTLRGKLKESRTTAPTHKPPSPKKEPER